MLDYTYSGIYIKDPQKTYTIVPTYKTFGELSEGDIFYGISCTWPTCIDFIEVQVLSITQDPATKEVAVSGCLGPINPRTIKVNANLILPQYKSEASIVDTVYFADRYLFYDAVKTSAGCVSKSLVRIMDTATLMGVDLDIE